MSYLYSLPLATVQGYYADALAALHALKTGSQVVALEVDGRTIRYGKGDIDKIQGYVLELKAVIDGRCLRGGAIGFIL